MRDDRMKPDRSHCWVCGARSSTQAERAAAGYKWVRHDGECLKCVKLIVDQHISDRLRMVKEHSWWQKFMRKAKCPNRTCYICRPKKPRK